MIVYYYYYYLYKLREIIQFGWGGGERKTKQKHLVLSNPGSILAVNKFSDYLRGNQSSSCYFLF